MLMRAKCLHHHTAIEMRVTVCYTGYVLSQWQGALCIMREVWRLPYSVKKLLLIWHSHGIGSLTPRIVSLNEIVQDKSNPQNLRGNLLLFHWDYCNFLDPKPLWKNPKFSCAKLRHGIVYMVGVLHIGTVFNIGTPRNICFCACCEKSRMWWCALPLKTKLVEILRRNNA